MNGLPALQQPHHRSPRFNVYQRFAFPISLTNIPHLQNARNVWVGEYDEDAIDAIGGADDEELDLERPRRQLLHEPTRTPRDVGDGDWRVG